MPSHETKLRAQIFVKKIFEGMTSEVFTHDEIMWGFAAAVAAYANSRKPKAIPLEMLLLELTMKARDVDDEVKGVRKRRGT